MSCVSSIWLISVAALVACCGGCRSGVAGRIPSDEQRYLGSRGVDHSWVTLTRYSTQDKYSIDFPVSTNVPDDQLQAWLLLTNGSALPPMGGGGGCVALGEESAMFDFKRTTEEDALYGVVVRIRDKVQMYKMPRTIPGLSAEAQFTFDWLCTDFSTDELESFETGKIPKITGWNSNWKSTTQSIKGLKEQLLEEGVWVEWDESQKSYVIKSVNQASR